MKKNIICKGIMLIFIFGLSICACKKEFDNEIDGEVQIKERTFSVDIEIQEQQGRILVPNKMELLLEMDLESLDPPLLRPSGLVFDNQGNLYSVSWYSWKIHKFSPDPSFPNGFRHMVFGKGPGQGPGEFSRILDMKIHLDKIYFIDEGSGAIEVYSTAGEYLRRINLSDHTTPRSMVVLSEDNLLIGSYSQPRGRFFKLYNSQGQLLDAFGDFIETTNSHEPLYQNYQLGAVRQDGAFYYIPRNLGFFAVYKDRQLLQVRATIDGLRKAPKLLKMNIEAGGVATRMEKSLESASAYLVCEQGIILKAVDWENEKAYWDFYDARDLKYRFTISDHPGSIGFAGFKNMVACLTNTHINIYSWNDTLGPRRGVRSPESGNQIAKLLNSHKRLSQEQSRFRENVYP